MAKRVAPKTRRVWRDADTGRIISAKEAGRRDPATVVHDTVVRGEKKK